MTVSGSRLAGAMAILTSFVIVVLSAYFETVRVMVEIWWRSETFTHAFLVPPIVGWLCWRQWPMLRQLPLEPAALALIPLTMTGSAWLLGDLVAVNTVTQFAVVGMLVSLVPLVFGWRWARALAFPLAFLFFCVPFGEFAMPRLMEWTADFTVQALRLSGVPVFREGLQFVIPTGTWSVVEACSGIRYIIASLTVGTLFAYLNYGSVHKRLIFIGVAFLVPIVANWVRAYLIVMLGHFSGNKLAAGVDHLIYGWVFFGVVIMLMFMIGAKWADGKEIVTLSDMGPRKVQLEARGAWPHRSWLVLCAGLSVLLMPWVGVAYLAKVNNKAPVQFPERPEMSAAWRELAGADSMWSPDFKNPSATKTIWFEKNGQKVGMFVAYYRNQDVTRKLVSSENMLVRSDNPNWAKVAASRADIQIGPMALPVQHAILRAGHVGEGKDTVRMHVYQSYWVNRTWVASDVQAKIAGAVSQLRGAGDDSAALVIFTTTKTDEESKRLLDAFLRDQVTPLEKMLGDMASAAGRRN